MHWFSLGVALLMAGGIIWIGFGYLFYPGAMVSSFGLPLPDGGENTIWWLRPKGVRDITSGVLVLAFMAADGHRALGIILLIEAMIPLGDMSTILAAKGRTAVALGVHGVTAALMILAAAPLLMGVA